MAKRVLHDEFFRKAKREGYAARSAYKLLEIDEKRRILAPGFKVLDLGCSPGSWMQVAGERVGARGVVIGVDLKPSSGVDVPCKGGSIVADAFEIDPAELVAKAGGRFHVLLSDMAPNTSGAPGSRDHLRSVQLCRRVLELAPEVLRDGGSLVMKVFEGEAYADLLEETGALFRHVKGFKPRASRDVSSEMFVVAKGYRGAEGRLPPRRPNPHTAPPAPQPVRGWGDPAPDTEDDDAGREA